MNNNSINIGVITGGPVSQLSVSNIVNNWNPASSSNGTSQDGVGAGDEDDPAAIVKWKDGLPMMPFGFIPKKGSITDEHVQKYWSCSWILDPLHDRNKNKDQVSGGRTVQAEKIFKKNITTLRSKLLKRGAEIAAKHYCDNFNEDGLRFNDGPITSMTDIQGLIKSKEMLSAFEEDPLILFGIIVRNVHGHDSLTSLAEWFVPELQKFCKNYTPPFLIDGDSLSNGRKGKTHCVLSVGLKGKGDTTMEGISNALESAYGMTVRKQAWRANSDLKKTHYQVAVDLGENNPDDLKTYILVKRSRHTLSPDVDEPPQISLYGIVRNPLCRSAYKFVQEAYKKGLSREDANAKLSETIEKVYGSGAGNIFGKVPPKPLNPEFAGVVKNVSEAMFAIAPKGPKKRVAKQATVFQKAPSGGGMQGGVLRSISETYRHRSLQTQKHQSNTLIQDAPPKPPPCNMPQPLAQRTPSVSTHPDTSYGLLSPLDMTESLGFLFSEGEIHLSIQLIHDGVLTVFFSKTDGLTPPAKSDVSKNGDNGKGAETLLSILNEEAQSELPQRGQRK